MKIFRLSILLIVFCYGCNTEKYCLRKISEHPEWLKTTDSITTHTDTAKQYKDTVVKIPSSRSVDTASLDLLPLDTTIGSTVVKWKPKVQAERKVSHSGNSTNILTILSTGKIIDTCKCDSASRVIKQLTETITRITNEKKTIIIPPKEPNFFQKVWNGYKSFSTWGMSIFILLVLIYILLRAFKIINKIPGLPF